jgi:GT2 family glycosyltransferase
MKLLPNRTQPQNEPAPGTASRLAVIIPTRDRPRELKNLLTNLGQQTLPPSQVIVIDSGRGNPDSLRAEYPDLNMIYKKYFPPSAARQRNEGLKHVLSSIVYVGFFDDDIVPDCTAIEHVVAYLDQAIPDVAAVSLNLVNYPQMEFSNLKGLPFVERFALYSRRRGVVLRSGFQTLIGPVDEPVRVSWFPSAAIVCRREVLPPCPFDPWFQTYSYLEDLDFSYRLGRKRTLMVIPSARFIHLEPQTGKDKGFLFGKKEVLNRVHFVRKHKELSLWLCLLGLVLKAGMNLFQFLATGRVAFISRALGNLVGLTRIAFGA